MCAWPAGLCVDFGEAELQSDFRERRDTLSRPMNSSRMTRRAPPELSVRARRNYGITGLAAAKRDVDQVMDDGEHELATCYLADGLGLVVIALRPMPDKVVRPYVGTKLIFKA